MDIAPAIALQLVREKTADDASYALKDTYAQYTTMFHTIRSIGASPPKNECIIR